MAYVPEENLRRWEITNDGRLWPCCFYANAWQEQSRTVTEDATIMSTYEHDPTWNDLNIHSIKTAEQHDIFQKYLFLDGWESDSPPRLCVEECAVVIDEYTGKERSTAKIQLTRD